MKNLEKTIQTIKDQWGLSQDISIEALLTQVEQKLTEAPDDPELAYLRAELLRKTGDAEAANLAYQEVVKLTAKRTNQRGEKLSNRVAQSRKRLGKRLAFFAVIPALVATLLFGYYWYTKQQLEILKQADGNPKQFAFTQWLAKQQAAKIVSNLQEANPNLSFDFGSNATKQSPMDFMESLLSAETQKSVGGGGDQGKGEGDADDGKPTFTCANDTHIPQCAAQDIPTEPGARRNNVVMLMEAYRTILINEKDCGKLEKSIEKIGEQLKWRKSEKSIKADMEDYAIECFYRQDNHEKVIEHARKLQCAGGSDYINSVYWYLTASTHQSGDVAKARDMYQCFNQAIAYKKTHYFETASVAARHRESGALAWLYFDDLDAAVSELQKARDTIKNSSEKSRILSYVASEIDLDLLETYVTANIDLETFEQLHFDINSSGFLTDGYKQIKDTLAGIYYLQNGKNTASINALGNVTERFKQIPEYVCSWDWSGFQRGLATSIKDDAIRQKATSLVIATDCYVPQKNNERINKINAVINSLK